MDEIADAKYKHKYNKMLKAPIRTKLKIEDPATLRDAMRIAERLDRVQYPQEGERSSSDTDEYEEFVGNTTQVADPFVMPSDDGPTPMELGAIMARRGRKLTDAERSWLYDNYGCFYCRKPYACHKALNCPKRRF